MGHFDHLAAALVSLREERGLKAKDLAERAGMKAPMISRYESGAFLPRMQNLDRILSALGISLVDLGRKMEELAGDDNRRVRFSNVDGAKVESDLRALGIEIPPGDQGHRLKALAWALRAAERAK